MKADRDWMINAACREHPPDDMFPKPKDKHGQRHALAICAPAPKKASLTEPKRAQKPTTAKAKNPATDAQSRCGKPKNDD